MSSRNQRRPDEIYYDESSMHIVWKDGAHYTYNFWDLRTNCPCAGCVDELTGTRTLDKESIKKDVQPVDSSYVGNYALSIRWNDGHGSGIFTFTGLRESYPHQILAEGK